MSDLPRVTTILAAVGLSPDLSRIRPDVLEIARARGSAVHAAIEAIVYDYFDENSVDPSIAPYLDAYRKFVAESGYEPIAAEIEVVHPSWQYRGHPDQIGWLRGKRGIPDFKTGTHEGAQYQLAAYCAAWDAQHPHEPVTWAAAVELRDNGMYHFHEIDISAALPVWYAAVTVFRAQTHRRTEDV